MGDVSRLVKAMQKASAPKENEIVDIVVGAVTSTKPLKIKVDKLELTESFLILSALCIEKTIKIPEHQHTVPQHKTVGATVGDSSHTHNISAIDTDGATQNIVIWRGLKTGDEVYMLRCCQGQKYYVLQRKEGI